LKLDYVDCGKHRALSAADQRCIGDSAFAAEKNTGIGMFAVNKVQLLGVEMHRLESATEWLDATLGFFLSLVESGRSRDLFYTQFVMVNRR
jgi:hypothetical protein